MRFEYVHTKHVQNLSHTPQSPWTPPSLWSPTLQDLMAAPCLLRTWEQLITLEILFATLIEQIRPVESIDPSYHGGGEGLLLPAVGRVPRVHQGRRVQVPARLWKPDSVNTSEWRIPENGFVGRRWAACRSLGCTCLRVERVQNLRAIQNMHSLRKFYPWGAPPCLTRK